MGDWILTVALSQIVPFVNLVLIAVLAWDVRRLRLELRNHVERDRLEAR